MSAVTLKELAGPQRPERVTRLREAMNEARKLMAAWNFGAAGDALAEALIRDAMEHNREDYPDE